MKRTILILLMLCMLVGMCGCAKSKETQTTAPVVQDVATLQVGFGRTKITPEDAMPLASYGDEKTRISTGFLEHLEANALAVTDGKGNTLLVITGDSV